jgi:hypothetical protein
LATQTDKKAVNEIFWTHKTPRRFGKENHGRVYTRKEGKVRPKRRWDDNRVVEIDYG